LSALFLMSLFGTTACVSYVANPIQVQVTDIPQVPIRENFDPRNTKIQDLIEAYIRLRSQARITNKAIEEFTEAQNDL
jgi:hypothetical protein